jgi:hypothetical protein
VDMHKFNRKRITVGIALALSLGCLANYYFDLGLLGQHSRLLFHLSFILLAVVLRFFGPSLTEMREYRQRKRI